MQRPKLYEYRGTVRSTKTIEAAGGKQMEVILHDAANILKAPVKVEAFGMLAEYIESLNLTDCAEKYMPAHYGYDTNLVITRITYKDGMGKLVKIVEQDESSEDSLIIFGAREYIDTETPPPMNAQELQRFCRWNCIA